MNKTLALLFVAFLFVDINVTSAFSIYRRSLRLQKISLQPCQLAMKQDLKHLRVAPLAVGKRSFNTVDGLISSQSPFRSILSQFSQLFSNLNPMQLLGGLYVVFLAGMLASGVLYKAKQLVRFVKGVKEEPPQLYECEFCRLEMRPARGRETQILSRRGFRCAQCGAPGSAFFNTENMADPRAVARVRRLKSEKKKERERLYGDDNAE